MNECAAAGEVRQARRGVRGRSRQGDGRRRGRGGAPSPRSVRVGETRSGEHRRGWVGSWRRAVREGGLPEVPATGFNPPRPGARNELGSAQMLAWESAKADFGPLSPRFQPPGRWWPNERCVRDARPEGRDAAARAPGRRDRADGGRGGGPARLATVVSLPTARAARPGAQRRDTPRSRGSAVERPVVTTSLRIMKPDPILRRTSNRRRSKRTSPSPFGNPGAGCWTLRCGRWATPRAARS